MIKAFISDRFHTLHESVLKSVLKRKGYKKLQEPCYRRENCRIPL